jgi:hypothetical protein
MKQYPGNPVYEFLHSRNLSVVQLRTVADLDVAAVYPILEGVSPSIPPRVMRELVVLGADESRLQTAYREYRGDRRRELLTSLEPLAEA